MFAGLEIDRFRGFKGFSMKPLRRVNLITGLNNIGKTALLEALYLFFPDQNRIMQFAGKLRPHQDNPDDYATFWQWLFFDKNYNESFKIQLTGESSRAIVGRFATFGAEPSADQSNVPPEQRGLHLTFLNGDRTVGTAFHSRGQSSFDPIPWPGIAVIAARPPNTGHTVTRFGDLVKRKRKGWLIDKLSHIDSRVSAIETIQGNSGPIVHVDVGCSELVPLSQLGQGFFRIFSILVEIVGSGAQMLLIDEVEMGIHTTALTEFWDDLATTAVENDVQVFATTHSYECIRAAHEVFSRRSKEATAYDLALHRLQRSGGRLEAITHSREMLETAILNNFEVR